MLKQDAQLSQRNRAAVLAKKWKTGTEDNILRTQYGLSSTTVT